MLNFFKRKKQSDKKLDLPLALDSELKPQHVAVVMDGNGRWAQKRGLSRVVGHKQGVESVKTLSKSCIDHNIKYLTIFAFSSENWNRPEDEVSALMDLLRNGMKTQLVKFHKHKMRLQILGDLSRFDQGIQDVAKQIIEETAQYDKLVLSVAINYGGRWDITQACQSIAEKVKKGELDSSQIDESLITHHLTTADMPDPDLVIRTSGENRISNFLLWQAAYAEYYFTDVLWPDFDRQAFDDALLDYAKRDRRYGLVK